MKKQIISALLSSAVLLLTSAATSAQQQCRQISCDCDSLSSESWQKACSNQEARIVANCFRQPQEEFGYCSLHGPNANALPLELSLINPTPVTKEEINKLNNKIAVLYWSMYKGFDALSMAIEAGNANEAKTLLVTFEYNLDDLFETQQTVAKSFMASGAIAEAQSAWRDYSSDTLTVATDIFIKAESILNNYDAISDEAQRHEMRLVGLKMINMGGKMYEEVGYAYSKGQRHKHAAQAWKNASKASALAMAHTFNDTDTGKSGDYYRLQSAARLHRASYHWTFGLGRGNAQQALAESQKFMDDNSEISSVLSEEQKLQDSQPYWSK
ncbi:hypothetical protein TDB9533_00278 [Thalassocella blandensis]|nr:hypothetical protein TDB9533_00278 [Thalassocella blandensis]